MSQETMKQMMRMLETLQEQQKETAKAMASLQQQVQRNREESPAAASADETPKLRRSPRRFAPDLPSPLVRVCAHA